MKNYPSASLETDKDRKSLLRFIVKERTNDVNDFNNLNNRFMSGRKVGKIPTGASDISDTDRVGDFNYDDAYFYLVTTDSMGDAIWGRMSLDIAW